MEAGKVTVAGSFAVGLTLRAAKYPVAGETVLARDFDQGPGGKGSNQAVQAARLGGDVEFVGLIGSDAYGDIARELYAREGVGTSWLQTTTELNTGVGFIILDEAGENRILLDPGANRLFSPDHVEMARDRIQDSDVVMTQLEIPVETARRALELGADSAVTILNPAPATEVPASLLESASIVSPNQTEARMLLGRPPDDPCTDVDVCKELLERGASIVVLTRGSSGVLIVTPEGKTEVPAFRVDPVDTTGAGDAFNGTFAAALARGVELEAAVERATAAGALACTRLGVIPALPRAAELDQFVQEVAHKHEPGRE